MKFWVAHNAGNFLTGGENKLPEKDNGPRSQLVVCYTFAGINTYMLTIFTGLVAGPSTR
jgi:hypothetical protein